MRISLEDRVAAMMLRLVPREVAEQFLASPDFQNLPQEDKDRLYVADALIDEAQRRKRQAARQAEAEARAAK